MPKKKIPNYRERQINLPIVYRNGTLGQIPAADNEEAPVRFHATFSSEQPVLRGYFDPYLEILDHKPESVRLARVEAGAIPYLLDHDFKRNPGRVESLEVRDSKTHAVIMLGDSDLSEQHKKDLRSGIRPNVSIGYRVYRMRLEEENEEGPDVYRVTDWELYECSSVSVPADHTVGHRSGGDTNLCTIETRKESEAVIMLKWRNVSTGDIVESVTSPGAGFEMVRVEAPAPAPQVVSPAPQVANGQAIEQARAQAAESARADALEILEIGDKLNMKDLANAAVRNGLGLDQFRAQVIKKLDDNQHIDTGAATLGLSPKEKKAYSFARAIEYCITKNPAAAPYELEVHTAIAERMSTGPRGILVPHDVVVPKDDQVFGVMEKRVVTTSSGGTGLIGTELQPQNFIEALRNALVLRGLGVRLLTGLTQNVSIPKQTGAATYTYVTEEVDSTPSDSTYGSVALSPKSVVNETHYSRNMLIGSQPSIEALVINDILEGIAQGIDNAALNGSGAAGQPFGVMNTAGIGAVTGTSLGWPGVVEFETDVAAANVRAENMAYVTSAAVMGLLKTRVKETGMPIYLANDERVINGYPGVVTNLMAADEMVFGSWNQLLLGMWGVVDLMVDPYTRGTKGGYVVRAWQNFDVGVRHVGAFSAATAIT